MVLLLIHCGAKVPCTGRVGVGFPMLRRIGSSLAGGVAVGAIALVALPLLTGAARGETLESALIQAYQNNPSLNSQRASVRATDEGVPQALSGYRPRVSITATGGEQSLSTTSK